jgi:hypothetical protein
MQEAGASEKPVPEHQITECDISKDSTQIITVNLQCIDVLSPARTAVRSLYSRDSMLVINWNRYSHHENRMSFSTKTPI